MPSLARAWFVIVVFGLVTSLGAGCSSNGPSTTAFQGFAGCPAGAASAIVFLQRSLDAVGEAEPEDLVAVLPDFDGDVRAMLLRAQEVHCTEEGFNAAISVRVDELVASGPGGMLLIEVVRERGLGSLDEDRGGLIELPTG